MASQAGYFTLQQFTDAGLPLIGGRLYTYAAGTATLKTVYTDAAGVVPHTYTADGLGGQYIALNTRAELPAPLYLTTGSYDVALKRSDGSTVWTRQADPTSTDIPNFSYVTAYSAGTLGKWLQDLALSAGSTFVGWIQSGLGSVLRTVQAKMRDQLSPLDFGAIGNGTTDDTATLQAALTAAVTQGKWLDGLGLTYKTTGQVTMAAGAMFRNAVIQMADANYLGLAYNSNCTIRDVTVLGTSRVGQYPGAQRGIGEQTSGSQFVRMDARVENCNVNFDHNGTSDSTFRVLTKNASGTSNLSEGYGQLLYQGASRNQIHCTAVGNSRHGLYISSGSSYNRAFVQESGSQSNFGVQINSRRDQAPCVGNVISGSSYGSAGGVVVVQDVTSNADTGGAVQDNVIRDFEVVGLAAASGIYVANTVSAYLLSISSTGAQAASGNTFDNCKARGAFASTSLGVAHFSGAGKDTIVQNLDVRAVSANTSQGGVVFDSLIGITRIRGINVDLLTSGAGITGVYANIPASAQWSFDDFQITCPSATKLFMSGNTSQRRLGKFAHGTSGLTAGAVTVPYDSIKAGDFVHTSRSTIGGTPGHVSVSVSAGVSFTLTSLSATDTSSMNWQVLEAAP